MRPSREYHYDGVGNLTGLWHPEDAGSYPLGTPRYTYASDDLNRLDEIQDPTPTTLVAHTWDDRGLLTDLLFDSGAATRTAFDTAGRVDRITIEQDPNTPLLDLDYTLDATGAVDLITHEEDPNSPFIDYDYDDTHQLTEADYPESHPASDTDFGATDGAGNRQSVTIGTDPAISYVPNALNQYASVGAQSYTYDGNGNLLTDGAFTYDWDSENQLTEVRDATDTTVVEYTYDPFGRRIRKTVDPDGADTDTWFLWGGDRLLAEHDDAGDVARRYVYGEGYAPVRVEIADGMSGFDAYAVHSDHLGTPRLLTDDAGAEVWRADYWAFGSGVVTSAGGVEFNIRFPGQYFDAETGLHYNYQRYYDPSTGRYLSPDPLGQFDHTNLYQYALNDPVNLYDPTGEAIPLILLVPAVLGGSTAVGLGSAYLASEFALWLDGTDSKPASGDQCDGSSLADKKRAEFAEAAQAVALTNAAIAGNFVAGEAAGLALGAAHAATGPLGAWLRLKGSYSAAAGQSTRLSLTWGSNAHYRHQIGSSALRNVNKALRETRLPGSGPRTADPGHLHIRY